MLTVYGDIKSGNCYKIKLLLNMLQLEHNWRHVDILKSETQTESFLERNPFGKVPVLEFANGQTLSESNAILNYLADGTDYLPDNRYHRALVLQWQFFEQYSHEPFIAVARYINLYLGLPQERKAEYDSKQEGGHRALRRMEQQLEKTVFLTGEQFTIADISLYGYTHVAHEGGFDLGQYPAIQSWLDRVAGMEGYISMEDAA